MPFQKLQEKTAMTYELNPTCTHLKNFNMNKAQRIMLCICWDLLWHNVKPDQFVSLEEETYVCSMCYLNDILTVTSHLLPWNMAFCFVFL